MENIRQIFKHISSNLFPLRIIIDIGLILLGPKQSQRGVKRWQRGKTWDADSEGTEEWGGWRPTPTGARAEPQPKQASLRMTGCGDGDGDGGVVLEVHDGGSEFPSWVTGGGGAEHSGGELPSWVTGRGGAEHGHGVHGGSTAATWAQGPRPTPVWRMELREQRSRGGIHKPSLFSLICVLTPLFFLLVLPRDGQGPFLVFSHVLVSSFITEVMYATWNAVFPRVEKEMIVVRGSVSVKVVADFSVACSWSRRWMAPAIRVYSWPRKLCTIACFSICLCLSLSPYLTSVMVHDGTSRINTKFQQIDSFQTMIRSVGVEGPVSPWQPQYKNRRAAFSSP